MSEDLKSYFNQIMERLSALEVSARRLPNQHLADLIKASHGRLTSAASHPDVDLLALQIDRDHRDGVHNTADKFPGNQDGGKPSPGPFPGTDANTGSDNKKTFHPGDPKFDQANRNPNFQDPNNVDLNPDGTLKTAPNAFSHADDRSKE
jgi:hypothetical protein